MYLYKMCIKNFRVIGDQGIEVLFQKGVNAVVGENNCGKSTIIDALRISFSTVPYKKDIFFSLSDFHINKKGIPSQTAQIDVYFEDVPNCLLEIWDPEHPTQGEFHICFYITKTASGIEKVKNTVWGGKTEGNPISPETFEAIEVAYLGALRDAENEMKPSRYSKLANLLGSITNSPVSRNELVKVLTSANKEILKKAPIQRTKEIINSNLLAIEQDILRQEIDVGLVEPRFESIASSLRAWIKPQWIYIDNDNEIHTKVLKIYEELPNRNCIQKDDKGFYLNTSAFISQTDGIEEDLKNQLIEYSNYSFELNQNGLGYNNLLFMSAVLGDMAIKKSGIFCNLFLIEEPEAHLHPQLQELIHSFFESKQGSSENIQIIYTSHSPTLVSRIDINNINLIFEKNHIINCLPLSKSNMDGVDKIFLKKYLDVTKSQMFFARGILFVEGISEAILIPEMARLLDRKLDKYAVEIVNINGVAFKPFANLLTIKESSSCYAKAAIVTDDDRCTNKNDKDTYISKDYDYDCDIEDVYNRLQRGKPSDRYNSINKLAKGTEIQLFNAEKTFEYAMALCSNNIPILLQAIETTFPLAGKKLVLDISNMTPAKKAVCIWLFIRVHNSCKGNLAQALCEIIKKQCDARDRGEKIEDLFEVPEYIRQGIYWVTEAKG